MTRVISQDTLKNGLKVVHLLVPRASVAHFGVAVRAGSGDELTAAESGLAHFVEHTIFKGTQRRSSWHIINRMENVGGELNAFTTKEDTVVYTAFPKGALARAVDLVVDLVLNSRFPAAEIDKEREVICDEINSYLDSPADAVYDDFEDLLYAGSPLGHNILGTVESVKAIDSKMCRSWMSRHYHAGNMVAFYAGPMGFDTFIRRMSPVLEAIPDGTGKDVSRPVSVGCERFDITRNIDTHQAHTVLGCALPRFESQQRMTLALLTNMLGGPGMNSVLNVALRERRGLVYNVESTVSNWHSTTMFTTYFGTDPQDNMRCVGLVNDEIARIADGSVDARRLAAVRKQYRGQLTLGQENVENRIIGIARAILLHGNALSSAEVEKLLAGITPEAIREMAAAIQPLSRLTLM